MNTRSTAFICRTALAAIGGLLLGFAAVAQPRADHPFGPSSPIPGQYIVVFKSQVANPAAEASVLARANGGQVLRVYTAAIKGFAVSIPNAAIQALRNNPNVDFIEADQTVSLSESQSGATWGIDRIDQAALPLSGIYSYNYTGSGVHAFIIDTGIRADHVEFTGRLLAGVDTVGDGRGTEDCNGHGTHVAGTVGGTTWGVAKQVSITPVRVLNCKGSGSWSGVIAGIDWVANSTRRPAVANMSLGGGLSSSVNAAVAGAVSKGVTMAVAAGNNNANACSYSPASEPTAITVGATASNDVRASYSNYGSCVDLFAPGSSITSAWNTSSTASNTISGTSMATPHVTGVAALVTQANPGSSPAAVASFITGSATMGVVGSAGTGSPNLLLYSLGTNVATPPPVQTVAVKGLTTSASTIGNGAKAKNWQAQATVTVRDVNSSAAVADATVTGSFAPGSSGSCVTSASGSCTLSSGSINSGATVFTVTGVSGSNLSYDSGQNSATSATISKP